jgi:Bacterial PH domain
MNWEPLLAADETLRWEGRPAPRCYTFRNWRHSLFGVLLFFLCLYWFSVALQLGAVYGWPWLPLVPLPLLLTGLYLGLGQLLLARLEWEHVFYAVTDRRILVRRGMGGRRRQELALEQVAWFQLRPYGEELGTLRIRGREENLHLTLACIEYPRRVTALLEAALARSAGECLLRREG